MGVSPGPEDGTPEALARLAGQVLLGECDAGDLPEAQRDALADYLARGKVVLFQADPADPAGPSRARLPALAGGARALLESERKRCDDQRAALLDAQEALAREHIPLVLLKTLGPYPYTSSNVDALVPRGELERAVQVLERAGHHEMTHYWEPNKRLLRRFRGRTCEVMVHLHDQVSWVVLSFLDLDALWSRATASDDPAIRHPAPEHVVALLLAHSVYESNRVSLGDVDKVRTALAAPGFDWSEVLRIARARAWLPGLALARHWYAAAERGAYGGSLLDDARLDADLPPVSVGGRAAITQAAAAGFPLELSRWRTKPYYFRKLLIDSPRSPLQKLWDLVGVGLQIAPGRLRLRRRPTTLVCLSGIDGSGKSTQAAAVLEALSECEFAPRAVWMRGGYSAVSEWLKRAARGSSERVPGTAESRAKTQVYRSGRTRWLWASWIVLEQTVLGLFRVRVPRWLGHSIVTERFVPDTLVDLAERFGDDDFARSLAGRALWALAPKPDLLLLLDLPGADAFARKSDDWDPEVLERRRGLYRRVLEGRPGVIALDATRPQEELEHEIVDRVLGTVLSRIRARNPLARLPRDLWE